MAITAQRPAPLPHHQVGGAGTGRAHHLTARRRDPGGRLAPGHRSHPPGERHLAPAQPLPVVLAATLAAALATALATALPTTLTTALPDALAVARAHRAPSGTSPSNTGARMIPAEVNSRQDTTQNSSGSTHNAGASSWRSAGSSGGGSSGRCRSRAAQHGLDLAPLGGGEAGAHPARVAQPLTPIGGHDQTLKIFPLLVQVPQHHAVEVDAPFHLDPRV